MYVDLLCWSTDLLKFWIFQPKKTNIFGLPVDKLITCYCHCITKHDLLNIHSVNLDLDL